MLPCLFVFLIGRHGIFYHQYKRVGESLLWGFRGVWGSTTLPEPELVGLLLPKPLGPHPLRCLLRCQFTNNLLPDCCRPPEGLCHLLWLRNGSLLLCPPQIFHHLCLHLPPTSLPWLLQSNHFRGSVTFANTGLLPCHQKALFSLIIVILPFR